MDFAATYGGLTRVEAQRLYAIRNAVMHSFGLYDRKHKLRVKYGLTERCTRPRSDLGCVWKVEPHWLLCLEHLYEVFVRAIEGYQRALDGSMDLKRKFTRMYHRYGYLAGGW